MASRNFLSDQGWSPMKAK